VYHPKFLYNIRKYSQVSHTQDPSLTIAYSNAFFSFSVRGNVNAIHHRNWTRRFNGVSAHFLLVRVFGGKLCMPKAVFTRGTYTPCPYYPRAPPRPVQRQSPLIPQTEVSLPFIPPPLSSHHIHRGTS